MPRYKLLITYDGTDFSGWQVQPNAPSIQGELETALQKILKEKIRVIGSGRTDAGVHALGQVAHFETSQTLDPSQTLYALNGLLPYAIRVLELTSVPDTFHAQYSATGKEYHYHLWLERSISPFHRLYRHHLFHPCSLQLLQEGASYFTGKRDFATFANVGSSVKTTERTLHRLEVFEQEGGVRLEFEGDGFLYKMVRNITGTLLEVATKKRSIGEIEALFEAKDRRAAGLAAPARGLFLVEVSYPSLLAKSSEKEG